MFSDEPLVSVLMTAYNRELYISEAIESVLASTYKNFELIIVDDGSSDKTVEIARIYEAKDNRVKLYVNEKNFGDYPNRNRAAQFGKGKYIKYLDSDDVIYPWGLEVMVYCMEQHPSVALGLTSNVSFNVRYPIVLLPEQAYKMYYFRNLVLGIGPTGTIIRRDVFNRNNGFSSKQFVSDTELWLRITQNNDVLWLSPGLFFWRTHDAQQIVLEDENSEIEMIRHRLDMDFLASSQCPLSRDDSKLAIRNLKNIKCRSIIREFSRGRFSSALSRKNKLGLRVIDFIYAGTRNTIPENGFPKELNKQ